MKFRIQEQKSGLYKAQRRNWYWPFWRSIYKRHVSCGFDFFIVDMEYESVHKAIEDIKKYCKKRKTVKRKLQSIHLKCSDLNLD